MKIYIRIFLLIIVLSQRIYAVQPLSLQSLRQIGMGGAGVAVSDGDNGLYQNPALLAEAKTSVTLPKFKGIINDDIVDLKNKISDFIDASETEQGKILDSMVGMKVAAEGSATLFSYVRPGFGIGLFTNTVVDGKFIIPASPTLKLDVAADVFPTIGFAKTFKIKGQAFSLGIAGKYVYRKNVYDPETGQTSLNLGSAELIEAQNNGVLEDKLTNTFSLQGYGIDLGVLVPFSIGKTPGHFGLAARNLGAKLSGNMKLDTGQTVKAHITEEVVTVVGVSLEPRLPLIGKVLLAGDYTIQPTDSFFNQLHLGAEKRFWKDRVSLQGGVNQGYLVMGTGLQLGFFELGYAYNTKELGLSAGQDSVSMHVVEFGVKF